MIKGLLAFAAWPTLAWIVYAWLHSDQFPENRHPKQLYPQASHESRTMFTLTLKSKGSPSFYCAGPYCYIRFGSGSDGDQICKAGHFVGESIDAGPTQYTFERACRRWWAARMRLPRVMY